MGAPVTREQACFKLAAAGHGREAPALLDQAERFPGTWHYTPDRTRAVIKHMPSGIWEVVDCAESEARIAALRAGRCPGCATRGRTA